MDRDDAAPNEADKEATASKFVDIWNKGSADNDCYNINKLLQADTSLKVDFVNSEMAALYGKKLPVTKKSDPLSIAFTGRLIS